MTRRGWQDEWIPERAGEIAKLITDQWDHPDTTDEGRWNMLDHVAKAWVLFRQEEIYGPRRKLT